MIEIMSARKPPNPKDNLKKNPSKSILKSSSNLGDIKPSAEKPKEATFDEKNIKETLHPANKDYGHMKIEEPKTPFEKLPGEEKGGGIDPKSLADRLAQEKNRQVSAGTRKRQEDAQDAKSKDFESRRKAHYDEFKKARELLKKKPEEDDDD